jgi:heme A synthase
MWVGIQHLHGSFRYVVLLLLVAALVLAFRGLSGKKPFTEGQRKVTLWALIATHIQLVLGLVLYLGQWGMYSLMLKDMSNPEARFKALEHPVGMILGIVCITLGYSLSKRAGTDKGKHLRVAIWMGLGLLIVFAQIPWPFMKSFGTW